MALGDRTSVMMSLDLIGSQLNEDRPEKVIMVITVFDTRSNEFDERTIIHIT
jgi:hypothetical protein